MVKIFPFIGTAQHSYSRAVCFLLTLTLTLTLTLMGLVLVIVEVTVEHLS